MKSQSGAIAIMMALLLVLVFIPLLGFTVDSGYMLMEKNRLQNVADAVSLACLIKDNDTACGNFGGTATGLPASIGSATNADLNPSGFTISATYPCQTSTPCATASASEVFNPFFMRIFNISNLPLKATATAARSINNCIIATGTITLKGSDQINGTSCSISAGYESMNGTTKQTANNTYLYNGQDPATCNCTPTAISLPGAVPVPALISTPTFSKSNPQVDPKCKNTTCNLVAGYYATGIDCSGAKAVCNFGAGSYYLDGPLQLSSNNGSASGTGVFFYMHGTGVNGVISTAAQGAVTLTNLGGTTGSCASTGSQLLFYSPNAYSAAQQVTLQGGTGTSFVGNVYLPGYDMFMGGGTSMSLNGAVIVHNLTSTGTNTTSATSSCPLSTKITLTN